MHDMKAIEGPLLTIGRDGQAYEFQVNLDIRKKPLLKNVRGIWPKYEFNVISSNPDILGAYQFTVVDLDDSIRVIEMFHNDYSHLRGKRIGYMMIKRIQERLGKEVISSTTNDLKKRDVPEFRKPPATRVWEELKEEGIADWCPDREVYYYPRRVLDL